MKSRALLAATVLLMFTGCGRGWLPWMHRGAACGPACGPEIGAPVAMGGDCVGCGNAPTVAGYGGPGDGGYMNYQEMPGYEVVPNSMVPLRTGE